MVNTCVRCGKSRDAEGDALLSNSKRTYAICFPCMKTWINLRDQKVLEFIGDIQDG